MLYPRIARLPQVAVANPVLEVDARLPGRQEPLRLLARWMRFCAASCNQD